MDKKKIIVFWNQNGFDTELAKNESLQFAAAKVNSKHWTKKL